jgi:cysteine desulfurase/selenocysteine lyase
LKRRKFIERLVQTGVISGFSPNLIASNNISKQGGLALGSDGFDEVSTCNGPEDEAFWGVIRSHFQIVKEKIYLNTATVGPSPKIVTKTMVDAVYNLAARGQYSTRGNTVEAFSRFLNVQADELALTSNTTEGINIIAQGIPLKKGDEVIITSHEHVGGALPWIHRAKKDALSLIVFTPGLTEAENIDKITSLISNKTKVIAIPHITTTLGVVFPLKKIAEIAKSKSIFLFVDGAHGAGSIPLDLKDLGIDGYASSAHKWLSCPTGIGFIYLNKKHHLNFKPYYIGAKSDKSWALNETQIELELKKGMQGYRYGTRNNGLEMAAIQGIKYFETIGMKHVAERISFLQTYLRIELLKRKNKIRLLSPVETVSCGPFLTFIPVNIDFTTFAEKARVNGIRVRRITEANLNAIRISTHVYINRQDIDQLIQFIDAEC